MTHDPKQPHTSSSTYARDMAQADREARVVGVALVATVAVWALCGFGIAGFDIQVFHTPLWIVTGCLGTWLFAVAVAVYLARRVITDVDLDDDTAPDDHTPVDCEANTAAQGDDVA